MRTEDESIFYLKDYAPAPFVVPQVELRVDIRAERTHVTSLLTIEPAPGTPPDTPLVLDGDGLDLQSIAIDGAPLTKDFYEVLENGLAIFSPPHKRFVLETEVYLDPGSNTQLMGLYRSNGIWCTQCEPQGFRRITYFLDRPDILSRYRVRLEADKQEAPILLANGNPAESGELGDGRHFAVWDDPHPKPSYLFAMVAGDLGSIAGEFTTGSGRKVDLRIYCEHGKEDQCGYAMDALKRSMAWDEKRLGREYDLNVFNIVAVSDFNFGAMENKGLNIFNDRYVLARPETATDADYAHIESIIAHEYFHNWTGNRITCRDWFQLCLKEGLTVFRDQEFTSDERSRAVKRIEDVRALRMAQFPEDAGPLAHPARPDHYREINNFYTATVYEKGAEIVRMLATLLGEEEFRKGIDLYFDRHDGEATTIEAWLKVFEDSSGRDLSQFGQWYRQAGTPEITISDDYDAESKTYRLRLKQRTAPTPGQPDKEPMHIPVKFGLIGPNGNAAQWDTVSGATISGDIIEFDQPEVEIEFSGVSQRPVPSLFRGFSAPVKINADTPETDKLFLARHDEDPFNRWQAVQDIAMTVIVEAVRNGGTFRNAKALDGLAAALGETLDNDQLDNAFKAHALAMPSEANIAQTIGTGIDPAVIHTVRRALLEKLGGKLLSKLQDAYDALAAICVPYSIEAESTRARALRNQCLGLIAAASGGDAAAVAERHYADADNITDQMAALGIMVAHWSAETEAALTRFRQAHEGDMLIFDKWLALNASAPDDGCLDRLKAIYADPAFPKTNPNRLRSLAGTFAMGNAVQFARADGAGFQFIAEFCQDVDKRNPQVAARVLTSFRNWANYEPVRKAAAHAALEMLAATPDLSRNTSDILTRTLKAGQD